MNPNPSSTALMNPPDMPSPRFFTRIFRFYLNGFRRMTVGRTLWKLIIIKLIIMFAVLKIFFFQDFLDSKFTTEDQKSAYVIEQITQYVPHTNDPTGGKEK